MHLSGVEQSTTIEIDDSQFIANGAVSDGSNLGAWVSEMHIGRIRVGIMIHTLSVPESDKKRKYSPAETNVFSLPSLPHTSIPDHGWRDSYVQQQTRREILVHESPLPG